MINITHGHAHDRCAHPRATAINSSALSGPTEVSGTSQQQLVQTGTTNTRFCSEMGQRKFVITPELALLIWYKCPFALGSNLYSGCLLDQWIFQLGGVYTASESWTEIPGRTYPQCSHPVGTRMNEADNNQRDKACNSIQTKVLLVDRFLLEVSVEWIHQ